MTTRSGALLLATALAFIAAPAVAAGPTLDLHAEMVDKLGSACRVDSQLLANFEPRMIVVHAVIDQTSLPAGWARARVLRPILGGLKTGSLLPVSHYRQAAGGGRGAHLAQGKEYLISMYRYQNTYYVDRALECQRQT